MYSEGNWRTTIQCGTYDLGIADGYEGGDVDSDPEKYVKASGEIILSAYSTRNDGKATYLYDKEIDAVYFNIDAGAGRMACTVARQAVGDDGIPWGRLWTFPGKVKGCTHPNSKQGSEGNTAGIVEISFALARLVA